MSKFEIIGPRRLLEKTVETLQNLGMLHIEEVPLAAEGHVSCLHRVHLSNEQEEERRLLEEVQRSLGEIIPLVNIHHRESISDDEVAKISAQLCEMSHKHVLHEVTKLRRRASSLIRRRANIQDDLEMVNRYHKILSTLLPVLESSHLSDSYEFTGIVLERDQKKALELIEEQVEKITDDKYELLVTSIGEERIAALLAYNQEHAKTIRELIWSEGVNELSLPTEFKGKSLVDGLHILQQREAELPGRLAEVSASIDDFMKKHAVWIIAMDAISADRLALLHMMSNFAHSKYLFLINAWAPSETADRIEQTMQEQVGRDTIVNALEDRHIDRHWVPVKLKNNPLVKPFELLLSLMPAPTYGTMDPSILLALFFPVFFGFILGDIGYGVILLVMALVVRWKWGKIEMVRAVSTIATFCSISTIVFGMVFGEFLGTFGHTVGLLPHWMPLWEEREKIIIPLLFVTIAIGGFHMLLGLVLGIYHGIKNRHHEEYMEGIGMLFGFMGLLSVFAYILRAAGRLPSLPGKPLLIVGLAFLLISVVCLSKAKGVAGAIEIVSIVSNVLSYARLMAIGIASVALASVANELGALMGNIVLGVLVATFIHLVNLALGIFGPALHSLRLHYVEFFPKFYHPDGSDYTPFRRKGIQSKAV